MEPINILAQLVQDSANDTLAGYQTFGEHLDYLKQMQDQYAADGIKLPLDLSEPEEPEGRSYATTRYEGKQKQPSTETNRETEKKPASDNQGLLFGYSGY